MFFPDWYITKWSGSIWMNIWGTKILTEQIYHPEAMNRMCTTAVVWAASMAYSQGRVVRSNLPRRILTSTPPSSQGRLVQLLDDLYALNKLRLNKAQIILHIRAVWSAPFLFAAWIV